MEFCSRGIGLQVNDTDVEDEECFFSFVWLPVAVSLLILQCCGISDKIKLSAA